MANSNQEAGGIEGAQRQAEVEFAQRAAVEFARRAAADLEGAQRDTLAAIENMANGTSVEVTPRSDS